MSANPVISAERLEEIRTLRAGITPGPWSADLREPWDMVIWGAHGTNPEPDNPQNPKLVMNIGESIARVGDVCGSEADARFIAAAPQIADDCLALAEENARLQAELARFRGDAARWQYVRPFLLPNGSLVYADRVEEWCAFKPIPGRLVSPRAEFNARDASFDHVAHAERIIDAAIDTARLASDGARHE